MVFKSEFTLETSYWISYVKAICVSSRLLSAQFGVYEHLSMSCHIRNFKIGIDLERRKTFGMSQFHQLLINRFQVVVYNSIWDSACHGSSYRVLVSSNS